MPRVTFHSLPLALILPPLVLWPISNVMSDESSPSFEKQIAPILQARCVTCHSGTKAKGDLDLTTRTGLLAGGGNGKVVEPGKSSESRLFSHVRDKKMPPKEPLADADVELLRRWIDAGAAWQGPDLTMPTRSDDRRAGQDWWSLQPIRRADRPKVANKAWVRNPVDAFILSRLEAKTLSPAPEADKRTYLRRVTLDLIGLLPTMAEMESFLEDASPNAYEKAVDRLLASPHYGERWGRHWLDVARFAESHGYETNQLRTNAWPYRDYVIAAFNEDRPFPRFVREQLAGDQLAHGDLVAEAATGFIVGGAHDVVGNATPEGKAQQRADDLFDMVSTTGTTFLGLTVGCARCHDHKFDPISQKEFYGLQAFFGGVEHAEREFRRGDDDQRRREAAVLRAELAALEWALDDADAVAAAPGAAPHRSGVLARRNVERFGPVEVRFIRFTIAATNDGIEPGIDELEVYGPDAPSENLALASRGVRATASSEYPNAAIHKIAHINDGRVGNSRSWISNERGRGWVQIEMPKPAKVDRIVWGRDREQKFTDRLATEYRIEESKDGETWTALAGSWDRLPPGKAAEERPDVQQRVERLKRLQERIANLESGLKLYIGTFRTPDPTHLLKRGDPLQKLEEIGPSALAVVKPAFLLKLSASEGERRLALADWITHPDNPLPARVMVNRVWHWHFGQGLVRTPSDFGFNGDRPSHPELLDWLASEYQANGWRLKPLHRLIVLSNTYRQSSQLDDKARHVDVGNRLLWRYPPRRLEAEAIRDTMLQVSGSLNRKMGGPGYHLWEYSNYVVVFKPKEKLGPEEFRRMVYQFKPRLQQDGIFGAFDCPDATQPSPRRNASTTALQALNLLNDPFVLDQSERFAIRLRKEAGGDVSEQVRRAFRLAFNRDPSAHELASAENLVRTHGLAVLCRALFNANEFVFVN